MKKNEKKKLIKYVKMNLGARLTGNYVSNKYNSSDIKNFYNGFEKAVEAASDETSCITKEQILAIFCTMMPDLFEDMIFETRKGSIGIPLHHTSITTEGLTELLEWTTKNKGLYGPWLCFREGEEKVFYHNLDTLQKKFGGENSSLIKNVIVYMNQCQEVVFMPPYDAPFTCIDFKSEKKQLEQQQRLMGPEVKIGNEVSEKFIKCIDEFNSKHKAKRPQLSDIAIFIKNMILIHALPNGNGRVFMLGVLNTLLLKYKYGICLHVNPFVADIGTNEFIENLQTNLVSYENIQSFLESEDKKQKDQSKYLIKFNFLSENNINNSVELEEELYDFKVVDKFYGSVL